MSTTYSFPLLLLLIITLSLVAAIYTAAAPSPSPSPAANAVEFIRTSCETTLYPDRCYHSLSGYANTVQRDPARLAAVAVGVSLARATRAALYVANLQENFSVDPRATGALQDCRSVFSDAVGQIGDSLKQMRRLGGATGEQLRFEMSNVQTWMSAALTNEDTCADGFEGVADGPLKRDVCDRTAEVKEVTSNALALVNSFVAKVIP